MGINFLSIRNGVTFGNQASVPSNPVNGDLYYDSTRNTFVHYNNGGWKDLQSRTDVATGASLTSANFPTTTVQSSLVRLTGSTSGNISGFAAMPDAKTFVLYNESTVAMTLLYNSGTEGTAANRIITPNQGDLVLLSGRSVTLAYDSNQARWVVITTQTSSSGFGISNDLDSLEFRAEFIETFPENATNSQSAVNGNTGFTNATYNSSKQMYTMLYDAAHSANSTGTAVTILTSVPGYTVAAGDVVINLTTGEVKKITVVTDQQHYTIESAFASNMASQTVCISQAVHTVDIYNYVDNGVSIATAFPATPFSEIMLDYEDNATANSNLWTPDTAPFVAYTGSPDNTNWMTLQVRSTLETDIMQSDFLPSAGTSLYLRFFSDKTSGSGFVNLISYNAFMQKIPSGTNATTYNAVWSAYGTSNNSTTPINCTIGVAGGKTTITFTNGNQYPVGVLPGQTQGALEIILNGSQLPRFVAGSVPTSDGYYTEVSPTVIQLDRDYSSVQLDIQITYELSTVDSSTTNTTQITNTQTFLNTPPSVRYFTSGTSVTFYPDYTFYTAAANATAGATYTNNGVTYTVYQTISGGSQLIANGNGTPQLQGTLTKASGTGDATIIFFAWKLPLWMKVRVVGGGGGGGATTTTNASQASAAGGGGGGGYSEKIITPALLATSYTYSVGGAAAAGGTSGATGSGGNASSFSGGSVSITCNGGGGGSGGPTEAGGPVYATGMAGGGAASGGDINVTGGGGGPGVVFSTGQMTGGWGGGTPLSPNVDGGQGYQTGFSGTGPGGGGSGASSSPSGAFLGGGTGAAGIIILEQHYVGG